MNKNFRLIFFLFSLSALIFGLSLPTKSRMISWDNVGYYLYLPSIFIQQDPLFKDYHEWKSLITQKYQLSGTLYQLVTLENGNSFIKYTSGVALLNLPFFLMTHYIVKNYTTYPSDGFSYPYHLSFYLVTIMYFLIGWFFLLRTILKLFDFKTTLFTLIILLLGTNLIHLLEIYLIVHIYAFTFYSIFLWQVIAWHENPNLKNTILLGLIYGIILLIRPPDGIIIIVFLLWNTSHFRDIFDKIRWFLKQPKLLLTFIVVTLVTISPQTIYWLITTKKPLINSYQNPGEGFDWFRPHLFKFLFSFRKGWIIYSPIVLLLIPAFILLYKHKREYFYPTIIFLIVSVYVHSSWTTWWYASSYGQRSMSQSYVILSIPLAILVQSIFKSKRKYFLLTLIFFFLFFNLFKYYQFRMRIIDRSRMTRQYYFKTFFNIYPPSDEVKKLLLIERPVTPEIKFQNKEDYYLSKVLKVLPEKMLNVPHERLIFIDSLKQFYIELDSNYIYSPPYVISFNEITQAEHAYLIIKSSYINYRNSKNNPLSLVAHFRHKGGIYEYRTTNSENLQISDSMTVRDIELLYLTPEVRNKKDKLHIYFWLRGKSKILVGPVEIEVWSPKKGY